jgi:formate hydrogenlyase transcriptional activator
MQYLNCAAVPDGLIDSELFGHERGAFTGAQRRHLGAFERADGGTLFLDEVGELSLPAQAKLLRVVQDGRVRRLGAENEITVDVRLIAATNRSLVRQVELGAFRSDLLYRLDVVAIAVPALKHRQSDLAALVRSLADELAIKMQRMPPRLSRRTMALLAAYDWPGNVRELRNVIEASMIVSTDDELRLPDDVALRIAAAQRAGESNQPVRSSFETGVRAVIQAALRQSHGKMYGSDGAAAQLGMPPGTLQSKIRKLGINAADFRTGSSAR